jgi:hypothetical protein
MRIVSPLLIILAVAIACQREAARASTDSPRGRSVAPLESRPVKQPTALSAVSLDARQVCASVAQRWREVPFSHIEIRDTIANPVNRDALHPNLPDEVVPPTAACLVTARADSGIEHAPRPLYWRSSDWAEILTMSGDGPGASSMSYQRGLVRCFVMQSWDSDDDSDSTYVPQKWFEEQTTCWRHSRALVPSDTAQPHE